jgi:cytochrome c oxidase assembly protein subunit 15
VVGIVQAREGLPIALVNIHLVLAAILVSVTAALLLSLRGGAAAPVTRESEVPEVQRGN